MIVHSVFFRLKHEPGSKAEIAFFEKASVLAQIPGVVNFKVLEEVSPKNTFTFGFSMEFPDQSAYDAYNNHEDHTCFVQNIWIEEVLEFQEIDHVGYRH
jgi:hypothetical protein